MIDILFMLEQIVPNMNPSTGRKKLNVHAARDGTAAGRHGGAPREHLFFQKQKNCTWIHLLVIQYYIQ